MNQLHDNRLKPLFEMHNQLRRMDIYHKERSTLVSKIHAEQNWLLRVGITGDEINNLIHDRFAKFDPEHH